MKKLYIRKIKEGKVERLKDWGRILSSERRQEAVESLSVENVSRELAFIVPVGNDHYFVGFMESDGEIVPADMDLPINKEHVQVLRECLEPPILGDEMYDLRT